jgi:DNA-binding response OmpR family regulator
MDYIPVPAPIEADETIFDAPPGSSWTRFPARKRPDTTLRYRGLEVDLVTGGAYLHERPVRLTTGERDLLQALMRRAGQIVSAAYLAEQAKCALDEVETLARTLSASLVEAGANALPRRVEGLGYILWR